jgi:hypothetical protein
VKVKKWGIYGTFLAFQIQKHLPDQLRDGVQLQERLKKIRDIK